MAVVLLIDTSTISTAKVAVDVDGKRTEKMSEATRLKSETLLPLIDDLLGEMHLTLRDITAITVATGPGSFTGLRVGATVANALGYLLNIPVNGKKALVLPTYS